MKRRGFLGLIGATASAMLALLGRFRPTSRQRKANQQRRLKLRTRPLDESSIGPGHDLAG